MSENSESMLEVIKKLKSIEVPDNKSFMIALGCLLFKNLPRIRGYITEYKYPFFSRKLYLHYVLLTISEEGVMVRKFGGVTIEQIISDLNTILERVELDLKEGEELLKVITILESAFD